MKYSKEEKAEALATLRALCPPGTTVYTKLNHCSRSGMSRSITPMVLINNVPRYMAWSVAVLFNQSLDKYDGLTISGCGMNMGFHLVYTLSRILYRDGFGIEMTKPRAKPITPKTKDEAAALFARGYRSRGRNGDASGWDDDGGYALNQCWI